MLSEGKIIKHNLRGGGGTYHGEVWSLSAIEREPVALKWIGARHI